MAVYASYANLDIVVTSYSDIYM